MTVVKETDFKKKKKKENQTFSNNYCVKYKGGNFYFQQMQPRAAIPGMSSTSG